jgi:hypothetical protein
MTFGIGFGLNVRVLIWGWDRGRDWGRGMIGSLVMNWYPNYFSHFYII